MMQLSIGEGSGGNMAIDPTKIGANMLAAREAKGVTRAELAMQVHLYPDLIRRYEKMEVAPGILNLIDLANALGIGLDTYVAGVSPASTSPDHFRDLTKMTALVPPNEPLTQADIDKMHFDRVWIDYGLDDSGERCGEEGVVLYGKLYAIDTLDGSAFDLLLDACDGETLDRPSGDYKVYRCQPNEPLTCEGCYWQTHGSFGKCIDCIREKTDHYCRPPEGKP